MDRGLFFSKMIRASARKSDLQCQKLGKCKGSRLVGGPGSWYSHASWPVQAEEHHEPGPLPPLEPGPPLLAGTPPPSCTSLGRGKGQGVPAREGSRLVAFSNSLGGPLASPEKSELQPESQSYSRMDHQNPNQIAPQTGVWIGFWWFCRKRP